MIIKMIIKMIIMTKMTKIVRMLNHIFNIENQLILVVN